MKKIFILIVLIFAAQLISASEIDSTAIQAAVQSGLKLVEIVRPQIIPFLPNEITSAGLATITAFIIRLIELRRIKRKHKKEIEAARPKY